MEVLGSLARRFASTPLESDDRARIVHEQLRMLWQHAGTAIVLASVFAVLLALDLAGRIGPGPVYGWLAVKLAIGFGRMAQGRMFMRRTPGGRWDDAAWSRATLASLALDGLVWGLAGAWLMGGATPMAALVGGALAGISCVATFGLQVSFAATFAYTIPILLPTGTALLARGDDFGAIGAAGLALLGALQCATARRSQRRLAENVRLTLRTQSLVEAKDEALALALRQSAVKSQFLASISHELRTPLHGILGIARLLHMESAAPAIVRRVELIEASGLHLLAIINDLLDMSRIEAGRFPMRTERFELAAQIEHVVATHAVRADDRGLVLQQAIRIERPHWVSGDPARFRQVLHNLIGNAIKFTQRGNVTVTLDIDGATPDMVCVQVRDTGPGIAPADLAHIFEAFAQSGSARASHTDGAGLGLTIAREIARAMGGDVVVRSALGVGSTLTFTARLPHAEAPPADATTSAPAPLTRLDGVARHVLIADDDDVNALIAAAYLERLGVSAERVVDGSAAVQRVLREAGRPDLVLMDCRMPTMDGYAATRAIRAQELALGLPRLPIVALTATVTDVDRQMCADAGMDDFVAKPFSIAELARVLVRWIGADAVASSQPGASAGG